MKNTNYLKEELYELIKTDESIFDFILESSLDGLWYWDLEHPEEEWMSSEFWSILGYNHREMPHKASVWQDIIHPEDLKLTKENFIKHCGNPNHPYNQTVRYTHKNGSTVRIRCRGMAIRDKHGKPLRMLGVHQEITAIKNNELLLEKNTDLLRNTGLIGVAQDITEKEILELEKESLLKHLNYALDASGDGIWDWTPFDGITVFSKAWIEMLGYEVGELPFLASEWSDRLHPDDAEWVFAAINKVTQTPENGDTLSHEYRFRNKAGDYLWIQNKAKVVERNEKGEANRVVGTHTNITERKKAQEEIKRTTLLLEAAQSLAKMGAWKLDLTTGKTFWTDEVYSIHEVEKDFDHNKANGIAFYHPDYRLIIAKAITDSIEQQIPFDVKCKFITAKNNQRWVRSSGYPVIKEGKLTHLIGVFKDITQEEADKEAIAQEQMFSKQLLENMADGFLVVDLERRLKLVNKAFCKMTGFSENELIGQTAPYPYWPAEELENNRKALKQTLAGNLSTFELTLQKKNGKRFPVQLSTSVLKDDEGNTINYFANIKDITEQKRKEAEIAAINKEIKDITNAINENSLVSVTDNKGKIILANQKFCELSGYTETELLGQNHRIINSGYHDKKFWLNLWQTIITGNLWKGEVKNRAKDGSEYWVSSIIKPIMNDSGQVVQFLSIRQDITDRKKAELELTKTKDFLLQTSRVAQVGGWDFDNLSGEISWSDVICDINELPHGFVPTYAQMASSYTPESWMKLEKSIYQALTNGTPYDLEAQIITAKGNLCWVRAIGSSEFKDGKCVRLFGVLQDINDRKKAELVLQESEKKFRGLFENLIDEVHLWKIIKDNTEKITGWQLVDANPATLKTWEKAINEVIGKTPDEIFGADTQIQFMPIVEKIFKTGKPYKWEQYFSPTGQYLSMESIPFGNYFISNGKDITEQKKSEQALKDSELRLSLATQAGGVGVWDWDIVANRMTWDDQMIALYGLKREAFTRALDTWTHGVYETDREQGIMELELAMKDEKEFNTEFRVQHPNGEIRNIRALATVIRDSEGNAIRMIGTNWDITNEKATLRQIEEAQKQAEAANKAKSEFLANMSHEIRTPLNGVIGFTELLTKTPLNPVQQQYANSANVSGHTLLGIINDILDFSKIEAGMLDLEVMKTDMVELLENSIDIVKFSAVDKEFELLLDIDPSMPRFAHIDAIRTKQILANLLSNAVKFTQKGEVALKVAYQALDGKQGKLSIFVRDTGIGISEEQKTKLFKSFSQADSGTTRKFGSTGLGLVISQMIAEKMGSKINIDSIPDVGSTFYFDIITHFEEGGKLDATKIAGVRRCLIIDDNDNNRLILEQMLKHWQIESDSCYNGLEALKKLEKSQPYDVIICDYDMPYFNGTETIRLMKDKLKLSTEKQPIILLHSSIDNMELNQKSKELGIRFRLNKPVKSHDLFNCLSHLYQTSETNLQKETEQTVNVSKISKKIKILIAEDNSLNMVLSKTMLSQLMPNSEIYEARNGLEAIEQYKSISPDLIFMDIHMPELDGIEVTKKIRALEVNKSNHLPIVALTAGALKEEKEKCLAAGMDDFLTKPLESIKIQTVLNKFFLQGKKGNADLQHIEAKNDIHFGFSELAESINDMDIVQQLISIFINDIPTKIDKLEQACNRIDTVTIKAITHSIKGSCLIMRCSILADIAGKMENVTIDNYFENLEVLLTELKEEWETVKNLLLQNGSLNE